MGLSVTARNSTDTGSRRRGRFESPPPCFFIHPRGRYAPCGSKPESGGILSLAADGENLASGAFRPEAANDAPTDGKRRADPLRSVYGGESR